MSLKEFEMWLKKDMIFYVTVSVLQMSISNAKVMSFPGVIPVMWEC